MSQCEEKCVRVNEDWVKASASDQGANCLEARWTKATASGHTGCVEAKIDDGMILVRDSKDPLGGVLEFSTGEWAAFLDGVQKGEFDLEPNVDEGVPDAVVV